MKESVEWLSESTKKNIKVATDAESLQDNHIYFAPDKYQMALSLDKKISLRTDSPIDGHSPSVTYLFRSVASVYGGNSMGIILTGMGKDGAIGLKQMKEEGAFTIAQDPETAIINGMPGEAVMINASSAILTPLEIAEHINKLSSDK